MRQCCASGIGADSSFSASRECGRESRAYFLRFSLPLRRGDDSDHASGASIHKVRPDDVCDALDDEDDVDEQQDPHDPSDDAEKGLVP